MKLISNQPHTIDHTLKVKLQWRKRCEDVSPSTSQNTHLSDSSWGRILHLARFTFVGIRSRSSCQEKTTTLEGAGLFHMDPKTISLVWLNLYAGNNIPPNSSYSELNVKIPSSSNFHHHKPTDSVRNHPSNSPMRFSTKPPSHTKRFCRHKGCKTVE